MFYFLAVIFLPRFFRQLSALKKMTAIKASKIALFLSFIIISVYLSISDKELVVDCFGRFATKEGVFGITRSIASVWLIGFIIFIARDVLNYTLLIQKLNRSILFKKSLAITECKEDTIDYYETNNSIEPVVAGFFLPVIYIPSSVSKEGQSLKQILSHEYIHLKNRDGLWSFLGLIIHRLNWHNPLSYFSIETVKTNLEMATDEEAILKFNLNVTEYAANLIHLISSQHSNVLALNISGSFLQIQYRLLNLKNIQNGAVKRNSLFGWVLFVVLGVGLSQAFASIRQEEPQVHQAKMCFQVKHELIIESWISAKRPEANKCE